MVLKNKLARVVRIGGVALMPGANTLDQSQETRLREYAGHIVERVENGVFELLDMSLEEFESGTGEGVTDITELNTREAISLVKETLNMKALKAFQKAESDGDDRKGVQSAIDKQIAKVEGAGKKEYEDDEEV